MSDAARSVMSRAQALRDFSAETLSALVKIPSPSGSCSLTLRLATSPSFTA